MKLDQIVNLLGAEVMGGRDKQDIDVEMGCGSDLMSDVLSYAKPGAMLFTGLNTVQVIYTAELADIKVVCFVRGKRPSDDTVRIAESRGIVVLRTDLPMFEACGKAYELGLRGCQANEKK
jgi:predicted transcriptional regulator